MGERNLILHAVPINLMFTKTDRRPAVVHVCRLDAEGIRPRSEQFLPTPENLDPIVDRIESSLDRCVNAPMAPHACSSWRGRGRR